MATWVTGASRRVTREISWAVGTWLVAWSAGCTSPSALSFTTPTSVAPSRPAPVYLIGDATRTLLITNSCLAGRTPATNLTGVTWQIMVDGDQIWLQEGEDIGAIRYTGRLNGSEFTATFTATGVNGHPCQLQRAELMGKIAPELSTFEATSTWVHGPTQDQATVQWEWRGTRK